MIFVVSNGEEEHVLITQHVFEEVTDYDLDKPYEDYWELNTYSSYCSDSEVDPNDKYNQDEATIGQFWKEFSMLINSGVGVDNF